MKESEKMIKKLSIFLFLFGLAIRCLFPAAAQAADTSRWETIIDNEKGIIAIDPLKFSSEKQFNDADTAMLYKAEGWMRFELRNTGKAMNYGMVRFEIRGILNYSMMQGKVRATSCKYEMRILEEIGEDEKGKEILHKTHDNPQWVVAAPDSWQENTIVAIQEWEVARKK